MLAEDREAVRQADAEDARCLRTRQRLPERIEDPRAVAELAAILRSRYTPTTTTTTESTRNETTPAA